MDRRSKIILTVGVTAVVLSMLAFAVLYSENENKLTFLTDVDGIAYAFVIGDADTGETHALEKGAITYPHTFIACESSNFVWTDNVKINDDHNMIRCNCKFVGTEYLFVLFVNGAQITDAMLVDGQLRVNLDVDSFYMAVSLVLSEP
jgi:hypothetical protein